MVKTFNVITTCTNRKRENAGTPIQLPRAKVSSVSDLKDIWSARIAKAHRTVPARDLYAGRAFTEALAVETALSGNLYVVSAGLGLIHGDKYVPSYNLTIADGEGRLSPLLEKIESKASDWWRVLNDGQHAIASLLEKDHISLTLLATPASYIPMIASDLASIDRHHIQRMRIFTSEAGRSALPPNIAVAAIPYDDRLEGSSLSGTRTDFAQRAMRHFVTELNAHNLSLDDGKKVVENALRPLVVPRAPTRVRLPDSELMLLIKKNWQRFSGSSTQLLRFLRDEALVSCEQSRFRNLHARVSDSMSQP